MFDVLYVDPPWEYRHNQGYDPARGGLPYKPINLKELKNLNLSSLCSPDAAIYCWATNPQLPEAIEFITSNGFSYSTVGFVWVKLNPTASVEEVPVKGKKMPNVLVNGGFRSGMGYYTNSQTELVLIGRRGRRLRKARDIKQLVLAPVSDHSSKPEEVRRRIDQLVGKDKKKLELFARVGYKRSDLWENWVFAGNQVPPDYLDVRDALEALKKGTYL